MVARILTCPDAFTLYTRPSSTNGTVAASLLSLYSTHGQPAPHHHHLSPWWSCALAREQVDWVSSLVASMVSYSLDFSSTPEGRAWRSRVVEHMHKATQQHGRFLAVRVRHPAVPCES
jgi:hypothetical protein